MAFCRPLLRETCRRKSLTTDSSWYSGGKKNQRKVSAPSTPGSVLQQQPHGKPRKINYRGASRRAVAAAANHYARCTAAQRVKTSSVYSRHCDEPRQQQQQLEF